MTKMTREVLLKKPFNDFRNYPYGFSRSGDFSIRESDALTHYGCLITAMLAGEFEPVLQEDIELLAACRGEQAPVTDVEKVIGQKSPVCTGVVNLQMIHLAQRLILKMI